MTLKVLPITALVELGLHTLDSKRVEHMEVSRLPLRVR